MLRSRWQFLAVVVTIFLGIALYAASADAYRNLVASYDATYDRLRLGDFWEVGGDTQEFATRAEAIDGVSAASARTVLDPAMEVGRDRFEGRVIGMPADEQPAVNAVLVQEGRYLSPDDPTGVLVEQHMAAAFGISVGDRLSILGEDGWSQVTTRGVVASAEYLWPAPSAQEVLVPADSFGVVFASEALVSDLAPSGGSRQASVRYEDPNADDPALDARLASLARETGAASSYTRPQQPSVAVLQEDLDGFSQLSYLFPLLFLTAAGLATYVLLTRLVDRQRPVIGMLVANGFGRWTVFRHYAAFGLVAGVVGAVPGVLAGGALGALISRYYTGFVSVPITEIGIHPITAVVGLAFGLIAGFACSAGPAWAAARETPAAAMRGMAPQAAGRRSLLERLAPPLGRLPIRWLLVVRNLARNWRRTLYTVIGVIVALSLVLVSWGMLDSVNALIDEQEHVERADAIVIPTDGRAGGVIGAVRDTDGVARAEAITSLSVSLQANGRTYATTLNGYERDTQMHVFQVVGSGDEPLPSSGLYVGKALGGELGVSVGDTLTLAFPTLGTTGSAAIAGFVDEPLGTFAYSTLDVAAELSGTGQPNQVAALDEAGADGSAVRDALAALPDVAAVTDPQGVVETMRSSFALFYGLVGIMLVFGSIMAFAMIFATMSVNIAERRGEIASLRAEGFGLRQLRALIGAENLVMVVMGIIPGLAVGALLGWAFLASFQSDQFAFPYAMSPLALGASAAAILIVAVLSEIPALRGIRRLDIATILRERAP